MKCPACNTENPDHAKFCHECGAKLHEEQAPVSPTAGERKYVTVMFSDLSGYTDMSEKLDPEEVADIMSRIFGEVTRVVTELEGSIDKFIGDAVLAVFGMPKAHEDDAVRAIMAARKIHEIVDAVSPDVEARIGRPLSMHTGINSGLIVTGEMDVDTGKAGITGDTINLASRLEGLSEAGEILVGPDTHQAAESCFTFEDLGAKTVKGKAEPINVYKVLAQLGHPEQVEHPDGLRADFIGRRAEMARLSKAVEQLKAGQGAVITISGEAGTGKSRLVEEFKTSLDFDKIQWFEAFVHAHRQQTPYVLFIDFLARAFGVEEGDSADSIRKKIETALMPLLEDHTEFLPYFGKLFALNYPEIEEVGPELWKARLHEGMLVILAALARKKPTVICFEDLHWADPSSLELLPELIAGVGQPFLCLCVSRPFFKLFDGQAANAPAIPRQAIRLGELASADAGKMLKSLLRTARVPADLEHFIQEKADGNPFYLEEIVNTLIEMKILLREGDAWRLTRAPGEITIPTTIQGVLAARLDRLEKEMKRTVQEASVIGREFFHDILQRISRYTGQLADSLALLQRLDLIRLHRGEPDTEYVFKHALTREVAYNGLLKKERREIHEQIAQVTEHLFHDRLPEFYETLAFHYTLGKSRRKAVEYLMKSGKKSIDRLAPEEAHHYYGEAFDLLGRSGPSPEDRQILIDLMIDWAHVFFHRADFNGLVEHFTAYEETAESLDDKSRTGMFTAILGFANFAKGRTMHADTLLRKALKTGEEINDQRLVAYACCWLGINCGAGPGLFEDAVSFSERARAIAAEYIESDPYLCFLSLTATGIAYANMGDSRRTAEVGADILEHGRRHAKIRGIEMGHTLMGWSYMLAGDITSAIDCYKQVIRISVDPVYSLYGKVYLGVSYMLGGRIPEAEKTLQQAITDCRKVGFDFMENHTLGFLGIVHIMQGRMNAGYKMLEDALRMARENEIRTQCVSFKYSLGKLYLQLAAGPEPPKFKAVVKNLGFLVRHLPFAAKKAERHLTAAIEMAGEMGANFVLGQASLDLGLLFKAKKKPEKARECISEAITILERCGAESLLEQAREALRHLKRT